MLADHITVKEHDHFNYTVLQCVVACSPRYITCGMTEVGTSLALTIDSALMCSAILVRACTPSLITCVVS